ncbi:MAG: hypothetical protein RBG13Loki_0160 [Promethearchaeota archaeon CR_4]|nr:MAG: hypothetical protein RBG13Loki_0160 [Candidatus Lokiarchaeota archaeon CR_4]
MPKPNPKHHFDLIGTIEAWPKYHNWWRMKRVAIGVTVIGIVTILVTWSVLTSWPDVREEDTVRVRYEILTEGGEWIEGSEDVTVYVDSAKTPHALFPAIVNAKLDVPKFFAVGPCPHQDCTNFGGYTASPHAWQGIRGTMIVLEVFNR